MTFPLYEWPDAVDYCTLIEHIETKYNIDTRDYAGHYSKDAREYKDQILSKWLEDNGYEGKKYVLDKPEGSNIDWDKESEEMKLRIEINTKMRTAGLDGQFEEKYPYLDYWHLHCDSINRGGINYLYLGGDEKPQWVKEIDEMIKAEVIDCSAYDPDEEVLTFHVDW